MGRWWNDGALQEHFQQPPFDLGWNWETVEIEYEGRDLRSEKVGVMTLDGYVQGAMLVSTEDVPSELPGGRGGVLLVELLFTAPRNRPGLRRDGQRCVGGVGPELLKWAVGFSKEMGCGGRLRLDASPAYVDWYGRLGFEELPIARVETQGVEFVPMELPGETVEAFLAGRRRVLSAG